MPEFYHAEDIRYVIYMGGTRRDNKRDRSCESAFDGSAGFYLQHLRFGNRYRLSGPRNESRAMTARSPLQPALMGRALSLPTGGISLQQSPRWLFHRCQTPLAPPPHLADAFVHCLETCFHKLSFQDRHALAVPSAASERSHPLAFELQRFHEADSSADACQHITAPPSGNLQLWPLT